MIKAKALSFFVPGRPQQKGSTKSFFHPTTKKIITTSDNKNLKLWEATVRLKATESKAWGDVSDKAIKVTATFVFPRPQVHYGTGRNSDRVKGSAPAAYIKYPDLDKLVRGSLDALAGVLFKDDRQIVQISASKTYTACSDGDCGPGAHIRVEEVYDEDLV